MQGWHRSRSQPTGAAGPPQGTDLMEISPRNDISDITNLGAFTPTECHNYLEHAGYAFT
jgi:hypothetical protein